MHKIFHSYGCVLQHDLKDCGPACLATVLRSHGAKVSLAKIRELSGTDEMGTSAYGIITAARELGLSARGIPVDHKEDLFTNPPLPAIAHVVIDHSLEHYMVIHAISKEKIVIADPAKGIVKVAPEEFFKLWTGFLILLAPSSNFVKKDETKGAFKRFFPLLKPYKALLLIIILFSIFSTMLGIVASFYFQFVIDRILPNNLMMQLHAISIAAVGCIIMKVLFEGVRDYLMDVLAQKVDTALLLGYYNHVTSLPATIFQTRKVGELVSRFHDATKIRDAISHASITILIDTVMAMAGGVVLFFMNGKLFLFTLVPVLIYLALVFSFQKAIEKNNRIVMENDALVTNYLVESLNGWETVKSFNSESIVKGKAEKKLTKSLKSVLKMMYVHNLQDSLRECTIGVFGISIIWMGIYLVLKGEISLGSLLAFDALLFYFLGPIQRVLDLQSTIQSALVAADRLSDILDLEMEKVKDENKLSPDTLEGDLKVEDVSFRYGKRDLVLKNISFSVKAGEKIALVGASGSGKTTIAKLLMGFYPVEKGNIFIGPYNMNDISIHTLRKKVAYISQNLFFFSGTIKENLLLANPQAAHEEVVHVCEQAQIHDLIMEFPLQYDTFLEENAANLSEGQKQRLAIARALLRKPDILIMDEATSNLDTLTETALEKTIHEISNGVTVIIIAHRLTTIMNCDQIYVLDHGEIMESGTHHELLNNGQYYSSLFKPFEKVRG